MITRSGKLSLNLVYQLTHKTMICRSKCRPLNRSAIGTNRCISSSSPATLAFAPEFFQGAMDTDGADVAWSRVAAILGINRLCALGSENIAVRYNWEQVRDEVQVKLISIPGGQETFILCKTERRQRKEHA